MMLLHKDSELFQQTVQATAEEFGIAEEYIDKDYFVSLLLKNIVKEHSGIVFKGGTSLSKSYGVINRFSEDIDINIKVDSKASDRDKKKLKEAIFNAIEKSEMQLINPEEIRSRMDYNNYEVEYESITGITDNLRSHLLVETYLTLKSFPFERRMVSNYIYEYLKKVDQIDFIKQYDLEPFPINVQSINRTFIDKLFAICDYHQKGEYRQNSRHFYDLHRIWENNDSFDDEEFIKLFYEVAKERRKSKICVSSQAGYEFKKNLKEILEKNYFKEDYNTITLSLLFEPVDYETVKNSIFQILERDILPEVIE